jgi:predicted ABC-type transport system involved in lysophospholipase L1 biosynthesis ATPase subunit
MNEPPLILADEPTGNLDATTGDAVLDLLFELTKERNTVLVMVTHNPETAARCSRTLVLTDGLLVDSTP